MSNTKVNSANKGTNKGANKNEVPKVEIINLKKFNLESIAPVTNNGANKNVGKYRYYENEKVESSQRSKFRKTLSRKVDTVLFTANEYEKVNNEANKNLFLDAIKAFNTEYAHRYLVNDFSVESLLNSNALPNFVNRVKIVLEIIKENNFQTLK